MLQTIEGYIDENGKLILPAHVDLPRWRRVILTILDELPAADVADLALMSETALAREWNTPEEDQAWAHLSQLPSL